MNKKNLRAIVVLVVVVLAAYQLVMQEDTVKESTPLSEAPISVAQEDAVTEPVNENPETMSLLALEEADGDFDYWVMALSWSPDYCATNDYEDEQQCSIGKQLDFVLHGLWPQYEDGWPSYCTDETLPYDLQAEYVGLYPNDNLFDHEWKKHGTCSGLTPEGYLEWSSALKNGLVIPFEYDSPLEPFRTDAAALQVAFVAENPTFPENAFAVYCSGSGRFLKEIFVCYEKDGTPRECSADVLNSAAKSCGQPDFLVRNTR